MQLSVSSGEIADEIDQIIPERATYGMTKVATSVTVDDVKLLVQAIYLRDQIGPWHQPLSQFIEGY